MDYSRFADLYKVTDDLAIITQIEILSNFKVDTRMQDLKETIKNITIPDLYCG
jgi:hypothetical protein